MQQANDGNDEYSSVEEFFIDSCRYGDFDDVMGCLEDNVNIFYLDEHLNNCIHMASANGHLSILKSVIEYARIKQLDILQLVNQQNEDGCTPLRRDPLYLDWAVINEQVGAMEYLLNNGAELGVRNNEKFTSLDEAIRLNKNKAIDLLSKYISFDDKQQQELDGEIMEFEEGEEEDQQ